MSGLEVHLTAKRGDADIAACGLQTIVPKLSGQSDEITCAHCKLIDEVAQRDRKIGGLLKENEDLRNVIAKNTRELPAGTPLQEQQAALVEMLTKATRLAAEGRLTSIAIFWEEGRAIVLHAAQKPKPIITIAAELPH